MKKFLLVIILIYSYLPLSADAPIGVYGCVTDLDSGNGLGYVTVIAKDKKNKHAGNTISDSNGDFRLNLKAGEYTIYFSFVGYASVSNEVVYDGNALNMGKIVMKAGIELAEVLVKPLISREADRIVYNVANDPDADRMKMSGIMKKLPELRMDPASGNLAYEKMLFEKILFDGKDEEIINSMRQYPMDFIKANVMLEFEVILPGSAEYGNERPILNIKLSRPLPNGIAGQLSPTANTLRSYGGQVDLITKTNLAGIGINYANMYSSPIRLRTETERINLRDDSDIKRRSEWSESWGTLQNHNLGLSLFRPLFGEKVKLKMSAETSFLESNSYNTGASEEFDADDVSMGYSATSSHNRQHSPLSFNGGVSLTHIFGKDKLNSSVLKYVFSENLNGNQFHTHTTGSNLFDRKSAGTTGSQQHVVNLTSLWLNFAKKRRSLYGYLNYIDRAYHNSTDYYYYDYLTDEYVADQTMFSGLEYRQQITNARAVYSDGFLRNMLKMTAEINAEHIKSTGTYLSASNSELYYNEFNLMPRLGLNYRKNKYDFNAQYNTRVFRPDVNKLNPFIDNSDPNNIVTGNPKLRGEYAHRLSAKVNRRFGGKWNYNVGLRYNIEMVNNAITRFTSIDANNISTTSYVNLGMNRKQAVTLSTLISSPKFSYVLINLSYARNEYNLASGEWNINNSLNGSFIMALRIFGGEYIANYIISPAFTSAQNLRNTYYSSLDMTYSRYFEKIHLGGSVRFSDILNSNKAIREKTGDSSFIQNSLRQRVGRNVGISVYWRFGRFNDRNKFEGVEGDVYDMSIPDYSK